MTSFMGLTYWGVTLRDLRIEAFFRDLLYGKELSYPYKRRRRSSLALLTDNVRIKVLVKSRLIRTNGV